MKGFLNKNTDGPVTVITDKGEFILHEYSFGRHLKDIKDNQEIEIELKTQNCTYDCLSRCTPDRCDCKTRKYAKIV